jgi:hypothetical protein
VVLVHELMHNFDVYSSHLHYYYDHAHLWTAFLDLYATRVAGVERDDHYRDQLDLAFLKFEKHGVTWQHCISKDFWADPCAVFPFPVNHLYGYMVPVL